MLMKFSYFVLSGLTSSFKIENASWLPIRWYTVSISKDCSVDFCPKNSAFIFEYFSGKVINFIPASKTELLYPLPSGSATNPESGLSKTKFLESHPIIAAESVDFSWFCAMTEVVTITIQNRVAKNLMKLYIYFLHWRFFHDCLQLKNKRKFSACYTFAIFINHCPFVGCNKLRNAKNFRQHNFGCTHPAHLKGLWCSAISLFGMYNSWLNITHSVPNVFSAGILNIR